MIDRREILEAASSFSLLPSVVEKDYVLGWILAGINAHAAIAENWVFKGGTCIKKCFFETYRFSEDLDFTLRDERYLDEANLRPALEAVIAWVVDRSGLNVAPGEISLDLYDNPRGRRCCQAKLGYRGPVSPTTGGWPKIKLDLTADERMVMPANRHEVFHPYTDRPEAGIWISCYAYEEAFAEKLRALGERTRPRDLYDVVNLYRHLDSRPSPEVLRDVLQQKCAYKGIPVPTIAALADHRADLERMWADMLSHQLPVLPPLDDFWDALPEIFGWLLGGVAVPALGHIQADVGEIAVRGRMLPIRLPMRTRSTLEIIRFAAANHLCVDLAYDGTVRRIEPYALRETADGNFILHAIRSASGEHRSYRVDRMQGATVTPQVFSPRYLVELTSTGPLPIPQTAALPRNPRLPRIPRPVHQGPRYIFQCTVCGKRFGKKTMDGTLRAHKNRGNYPCSGRYGTYIRTRI